MSTPQQRKPGLTFAEAMSGLARTAKAMTNQIGINMGLDMDTVRREWRRDQARKRQQRQARRLTVAAVVALVVMLACLVLAARAEASLYIKVQHKWVSVRWVGSTSYTPCTRPTNKCGTSRVQLLWGGVVQGGRTYNCVKPRALVAGKYHDGQHVGVFVRACGNVHRWEVV